MSEPRDRPVENHWMRVEPNDPIAWPKRCPYMVPILRTGAGWRIDSFTVRPGDHYRYAIVGVNHYTEEQARLGRRIYIGPAIHWQVPSICGSSYYFGLRLVPA